MATWTTMTNLATGDLVTEADMDAIRGNIEYLLSPNNDQVLRDNSGTYSTTSTTFVDVDGSNILATITTNGGPVLVLVTNTAIHTSAGGIVSLDIAVDGTRYAASFANGMLDIASTGSTDRINGSLAVIITGLSAASHTFKLQWKTAAGTAQMISNSANANPVIMAAIEV